MNRQRGCKVGCYIVKFGFSVNVDCSLREFSPTESLHSNYKEGNEMKSKAKQKCDNAINRQTKP